jgi:hypothetical protein
MGSWDLFAKLRKIISFKILALDYLRKIRKIVSKRF